MNSNERSTLEAMLAVTETNEHKTISLLVHTESSAEDFVNHLVHKDIPTWANSREIDNKRLHHSGVVSGWATAGLISAEKSDEYQNRINKAICSRIKELLT
ncbi:hypothetical protein [Vibrio crassostreae]|uniref:hypothetical protein n=1 Tax=Vibrio crassostreae TaxID=246167 RepID=UPI001B307AF0|nr:hypothetical protein [Vibrio crassostreae]